MSRSYLPDQVLIDRLLLSDTVAFEELYRRYWYSLYSYSNKKLYSSDDARRIVRDIFIQLWEKRHHLPVDFSISEYLYKEVRSAVVVYLNEKLNVETVNEMIEKEVAHGFSVQALKAASQPVLSNTGTARIRQTAIKKNNPKYFITLAHLRWLFQTVTTKLL